MTSFSYQLYSSRNFPPLEDTLKMLRRTGYTEVESYGAMYSDPAALKAALEAADMKLPSGHLSLDAAMNELDGSIAMLNMLGLSSVYIPYLQPEQRPTNAQGWTEMGQQLEKLSGTFNAAGLHFGYHNHDFEFLPTDDGSIPMRLLLDAAPSIGWEADLAWVVRGQNDPLDWIAEYGVRISAVHIKDIAPSGECADEDGWADVGHGTMNWQELMTALKPKPVRHFIMEHDNPRDDARFAARSLQTLQSF